MTLKKLPKLVVRIHGHSPTAIDVVETSTSKSELFLLLDLKMYSKPLLVKLSS